MWRLRRDLAGKPGLLFVLLDAAHPSQQMQNVRLTRCVSRCTRYHSRPRFSRAKAQVSSLPLLIVKTRQLREFCGRSDGAESIARAVRLSCLLSKGFAIFTCHRCGILSLKCTRVLTCHHLTNLVVCYCWGECHLSGPVPAGSVLGPFILNLVHGGKRSSPHS